MKNSITLIICSIVIIISVILSIIVSKVSLRSAKEIFFWRCIVSEEGGGNGEIPWLN